MRSPDSLRMLTTVSTRRLSAAARAARERRARAAICRLRDCSREIERIAAGTRAARAGCAGSGVGQGTARICDRGGADRVELRKWDVGSPLWIEYLEARLDRLAAAIGLIAEASLTHGQVALARPGHARACEGSTEQVEGSVYNYPYPRTGTAPAVG